MNRNEKVQLIQNIIYRSIEDSEFKNRLLKNPNEIIRREYAISNGVEFKILEHHDQTIYFVIPYLSSEELVQFEAENACSTLNN